MIISIIKNQVQVSFKGSVIITPPIDPPSNTYSFTLTISSRVSAKVYKNDGEDDILISDLFGGITLPQGTHQILWDGQDNEGIQVPNGSYKIKVLSNNVTYDWEGVIGNTSTAKSGPTVRHESEGMIYGMAINGTDAFYTNGFHERTPTYFKFNTATPNEKNIIDPNMTGHSYQVATDGTRVYFTCANDDNQVFIVAINISNNTYVTFSNGVTNAKIPHAGNYVSAIGLLTSNDYKGIAVQTTGNYLFASTINTLYVLNKLTGVIVQTLVYTNIGKVALQGENSIWMIVGTTVSKYTVNSNGTLTTAILSLSGLVAPLALAVSPDGTKVSVADGGNSQQIKTFNTSTGALIGSPLGQSGGYANGPNVNTNKFYFANTKRIIGNGDGNDNDRQPFTFITYAPDGSFWVGDTGNCRALHYSSSNVFIELTMNLGYNYSVGIDQNNPNRGFCNYLEFDIDSTKPLLPNNGSWTLIRNWAYNMIGAKDAQFSRLKNVVTLSNNRTYALARVVAQNKWEIIELASTGLRFTGVFTPDLGYTLEKNDQLRSASNLGLGQQSVFKVINITSFDGLGNPILSSATIIATSPTITGRDPISENFGVGRYLSDGSIVTFNNSNFDNGTQGDGYHIGILKGTKWVTKFSKSTWRKYIEGVPVSKRPQYQGEFPDNGDYDIGNGVGYTSEVLMVIDDSIFYIYNGEFWKNTQTNKINHFHKSGLFLGQMGTVGPFAYPSQDAAPMMAGNAKTGQVVKIGNNYRIVHADESFHGGIHVWKISGMDTIQEQTIPYVKTGVPVLPALNYVNLMSGLPFADTLINNTSGWTRNPISDFKVDDYNRWEVLTSRATYKKGEMDILISNYPTNAGATRGIARDLGNNIGLPSWEISGELAYLEPEEKSGSNCIDILDNANKVIARLSRLDINPNFTLIANGVNIVNTSGILKQVAELQPFSIQKIGNNIVFKYMGNTITGIKFDVTSDITNPKTFRVQMSSTNNTGRSVNIANLIFKN